MAIILLIIAAFSWPCCMFFYYGFKRWTYFPAFTTGIGSLTMMLFILIRKFHLKEEICTWIEKTTYHKLDCAIIYNNKDFLYLSVAMIILCLILSILFLCDELNKRDKECDELKLYSDHDYYSIEVITQFCK